MSTPSVTSGTQHDRNGLEFLFRDSMKLGKDPGTESDAEDDDLLDWFVLDWDDEESPSSSAAADAAPDAEPEPPGDLPLHLAAPMRSWSRTWTELLFGFGAIVAAELAFGTGIGSYGLEPHPYWLVILPIAAARGLVAGLVAAGLGAALFFFGAMQAQGITEWVDLLDYSHGLTPLGFFLAAFLVGQVRDSLAARHDELWRYSIHSTTDRARAAARVQRLVHANRDLKLRLLDHGAQFGHLLEAAKRLDSATPKGLFEVTLDMVLEHCGGEKCCVLDTRGDTPRIVAIRGWSTDDLAHLSEAVARSAVVRDTASSGRLFNVFDFDDAAGDDDPLLIAPLCGEDGTVEALLCLDALTPDRFSQSTASVFFGIGEWAQLGMQRIAAGRRPGLVASDGSALLRSHTWVGNAEDLPARLCVEDGRLTETGLTTCLIPIHAVIDDIRESDQHKLDQLLESTVLNGILRGADSLYRLPERGAWVLVLPATPKSSARVVRRRLDQLLELLRFGKIRRFRTEVVAPEPWRGTLSELAPAVSAWVRDPDLDAIPRLPAARPTTPRVILDAMEFARRVQVESHLGRRFRTDLYVVELDFASVPVERPEVVVELLATFAERFLPATATVHNIEANRFALVMPHARCSGAFRAGYELSRSVATRLGLPSNQGVRFGVFALGGRHGEADTVLFDLFRIKGRRVHEDAVELAEPVAPAQEGTR